MEEVGEPWLEANVEGQPLGANQGWVVEIFASFVPVVEQLVWEV